MKKTILIIILAIGFTANAQWISLPEEESFQFTTWIDVVSAINEEITPPHTGIEITYMGGGFVSLGISYFDLTPAYFDITGSGGINLNLFNFDRVRYYAGGRIGVEFRESNPYPLVGAVLGFDWKATDNFSIGLRGWFDYRSSQDNQFYGDDSAYQSVLIIDNPMTQENGAIVLNYTWDWKKKGSKGTTR